MTGQIVATIVALESLKGCASNPDKIYCNV